jgi:hypothetical protein
MTVWRGCKHLDIRILRRYNDVLVMCNVCGIEVILPYEVPADD